MNIRHDTDEVSVSQAGRRTTFSSARLAPSPRRSQAGVRRSMDGRHVDQSWLRSKRQVDLAYRVHAYSSPSRDPSRGFLTQRLGCDLRSCWRRGQASRLVREMGGRPIRVQLRSSRTNVTSRGTRQVPKDLAYRQRLVSTIPRFK
jgi:hypothetical protein